jgi:hypothetical protein
MGLLGTTFRWASRARTWMRPTSCTCWNWLTQTEAGRMPAMRNLSYPEWSDLHQLSSYPMGYHKKVEKHLGPQSEGADLIWEMYVPRDELISFVEDARRVLLKSETRLIYGTVRFIEQDHDSFLAWAKRRYACVIFTPHCLGTPAAMRKAGAVCRELIRAATGRRGSFYLTYNRFAKRDEMDGAYPEFAEFLELKKKFDSVELLQTDWYRHYKNLYL